MQSDIRAGLTGALAGAAATLPLTAVMLGAQRLGFLGESPPRLISSVALGAQGEHDPPEALEKIVATELHLAIGVVNGVAYGLLSHRVNLPGHPALRGTVFGIAVWLLAYRGWLPMLKIMPPIERDRPDRQISMLAAHLFYGGVLGWLTRKFSG